MERSARHRRSVKGRSARIIDPTEKLRLLAEAYTLVPDNAKPGIRTDMAVAEFDAAGDDASTERDARAMTDNPSTAFEYNLGQTLLGRALPSPAGDTIEGKERLLASITPPAKFKNAGV